MSTPAATMTPNDSIGPSDPSWKNGTPVVARVVAPDSVKAAAYMRG